MTNTYTNRPATSKTRTGSSPCGCGGSSTTTAAPECCGLICFERPRYFCGHLLTDDDLSLEQRYLVEKNRLRNRELHGKGIVCGLKISCDPDCCGHVLIGDGYAIDDCGNDLVLCSPYSFDVIGALPKPGAMKNDCDDDTDDAKGDDCTSAQCYYIAACYYEEESDYTTPFVAGCNSTPGTCEPTRIHEKVRFKLLHELPEKFSYLDQVEARIRECWSPFTKGRFADVITGYYQSSTSAAGGPGNYDRFCQLRTLFLQQLQKRPSPQNCLLEGQVRALDCPDDKQKDPAGEKTAFEKLLTFIHQYVYDCMLAQFAFDCKSPCKPCCVILGSVEIDNGKIVRVCNCEREYVWSFANFIEVLLFTILQGGVCHSKTATSTLTNRDGTTAGGTGTTTKDECCPGFSIDATQFGALYQLDPKVREYSGQTFVKSIRALTSSLQESFQFTQPGAMSPQLFEQKPLDQVLKVASTLGLAGVRKGVGSVPTDLLSTLRESPLIQQGDYLLAYTDANGKIMGVLPEPAPTFSTGNLDQAPGAAAGAEDVQGQLEALKASHAELQAKIAALEASMKPQTAPPAEEHPAPPAPAAPEGGNPETPHGG